jgi:hypothetical protein
MKKRKQLNRDYECDKDLSRSPSEGECFKSRNGDHFLRQENEYLLHVNVKLNIISSLTKDDKPFECINCDMNLIKIKQEDFNYALNQTIFNLNLFDKKYKN